MRSWLAAVRTWLHTHVDGFDLVGLLGVGLAFNGAEMVWSSGVARLGLGLGLVAFYVLRESLVARARSGGDR